MVLTLNLDCITKYVMRAVKDFAAEHIKEKISHIFAGIAPGGG
jgi:hypothetical protein